jgi:glycosyltransferase involved in cell wall biosynthesis
VAGGGELLDDYRLVATEAGITGRVHFLGPVPHAELPNVLRAADLFLLTTEPPESFGIVLIEAMACGLATIVTEYPGVRAVVDDGETGLVIEPGDPEATSGAIQRLADGRDERVRMGQAGRQKASRLWSWPHLLDRMDEAYVEAIGERRARSA